jgi:hypothetical protein
VLEYSERARGEAVILARSLGITGNELTAFLIGKREEARQLALLNLPYMSPTYP